MSQNQERQQQQHHHGRINGSSTEQAQQQREADATPAQTAGAAKGADTQQETRESVKQEQETFIWPSTSKTDSTRKQTKGSNSTLHRFRVQHDPPNTFERDTHLGAELK